MSNKSRARRANQRHPQLRRRATGVAAVFGGAVAAAFVSSGTALAIPDADAFDDIGLPGGTLLDTTNPMLSAQLDPLVDMGLPVGTQSDADAFSDLGLPGGSLLDALDPALSQQLDPLGDQIGSIITPDNDAYFDLVQAFDPHAATDSLGMFALDLDTLLTPFGFEPALDAAADNLLSLFGLTAM
jgi:hypothetical protein